MAVFSLIVPTRGRPHGFRRLLDSLRHTTHDLSSLEVIAVIDEDDLPTRAFTYTGIELKRAIVAPGQTMGNLNLAGYRMAAGQYLMLLNDDVVVRTPAWDLQVLRSFQHHRDGMVLVHVNDLLFRDTLCTFPFLTRRFCELAGGICRPEYRRYRIDDHIHHVFDLLHTLGHTRRIFLPDVIFEHQNAVETAPGVRQYVPDPAILDEDDRDFEALAGERRRLALACAEEIAPVTVKEREHLAQRLEQCRESIPMRHPGNALWWPAGAPSPSPARRAPEPADRVPQFPFLARMAFRLWERLALLAAHWPLLARAGVGIPPALFDPGWYRSRYPDLAQAGGNLLVHYLRRGGWEAYNPNPHFDSAWYLANNPDVAASGLNPLVHFFRYGAHEGRNPNLLFDLRYYQMGHPEIARHGSNPLAHFLTIGLRRNQTPNPACTLSEYLDRRSGTDRRASPVAVAEPAPISVVIPTRNRSAMLAHMLDACRRHTGGCDVEFLVMDDGSTDDTSAVLRDLASGIPNLRWQSLPAGGPARARNQAAMLARHDVLLFLGDDIVPSNDEFFRVHALRHAENPHADFAVLGKVDWPADADFPVTFTMAHIQREGSQFAFSRLQPGDYAGWQFFYTSNLSLKKSRIRNWDAEGFAADFHGAALEDSELGYRLWRSPPGLRLFFDPASLGLHYHHYTLKSFLDRQVVVGRSLRKLIDLHPELEREYALEHVHLAFREPGTATRSRERFVREVETLAYDLEARGTLGTEEWHGKLLSALFEVYLHTGYVSTFEAEPVNVDAARAAIASRFFSRLGNSVPRAIRNIVAS